MSTRPRRLRRLLLRTIFGLSLLAAIAGATLPWWWPTALRAWGESAGLQIGETDTSGWGSVELRDVRYQTAGLQVRIAALRVPGFGVWPRPENGPAVFARDVVIQFVPRAQTAEAPVPSVHRATQDILRAWPTLERWLPPARAENVVVEAGAQPVQIGVIAWDGERATCDAVQLPRAIEVAATLERPRADVLRFAARVPRHEVAAELTATNTENQLELAAQGTWRDDRIQVSATFPPEGLWPTRAELRAPEFDVPLAELGLPGYGPARGNLEVAWADQAFSAAIQAHAEPGEAEGQNLPPVSIDVRASGTVESLRVDAARLVIPGVEATLSNPLVLELPSGAPESPAIFALNMNLAELAQAARISASGQVSGRAEISGAPGTMPAVQFALEGDGVRWRNAQLRRLTLVGSWRAGRLEITQGEARLGDDAFVRAQAEIDLDARQIAAAEVEAELTAAAVRPWWPAAPEFAHLALNARAAGSVANPQHEGSMQFRELAGVPGGTVGGELTWRGEGLSAIESQGELRSAAEVSLPFELRAGRSPDGPVTLELVRLAWADAQGEWWHLAQPAAVRWSDQEIGVEQLALTGEEVALEMDGEITWPVAGRVHLAGRGWHAGRLAKLLPKEVAAASVDRIELTATWSDGPAQIEGTLRASYAATPETACTIESSLRTEAGKLVIGAIQVLGPAGNPILAGEGRLPLSLTGGDEGFSASLPRDGELALQLASTPNPGFWQAVTQATGWGIENPVVEVALSGSLDQPRGRVVFAADTLEPPDGLAGAVTLPRLGDVRLVGQADGDGFALTQGMLTINGQWVTLVGRAPWDLWQAWREKRGVPWQKAEFTLAADRFPMAIPAGAVPRILSSEGSVSFKAEHHPDRGFGGFLWLDGVALRPIAPVGAIRDIGGRVELDGYAITVPGLSAHVGGRPLTITGSADVRQPAHPVFDVRLQSSRVPLVRQQGLVLRAELDLRLQQSADAPARISGDVELGQSVIISELAELLPTGGGLAQPEQRPPYFHVEAEPFANWTLDVGVHGEDFLRVENPFFQGTVSADFRLGGTLEDPHAVGRASSNTGTIIFPFGGLRLEQLEVALTEQNPHEPRLLGSATSRLYGYDLRLEISGTPSDPRLLFSSEPPLTSQEVFLMLSTGEIPEERNAFSTSERAQRLAMFVGRNLAHTLGLTSGGGGEERLVVRSGEDFSTEGGETIHIQYNLSDRWALVAEKDRFDAYNAGVKFRIISR